MIDDLIKQIGRDVKRLEASNTRLKRRNARTAANRTLREMGKRLMEAYPSLRDDGSAVEPVRQKGAQCPSCGVPFKKMEDLLDHMVMEHPRLIAVVEGEAHHIQSKKDKGKVRCRCLCGRQGNARAMIQHLHRTRAAMGLKDHFTAAMLVNPEGTAELPESQTF